MKTRNAGVPKPSPTAKKTPPARKSATKATPSPSLETSKTVETKRTSARAAKQVKKTETTPVAASKSRQSSAEEEATGSAKAKPGTKVGAATVPVGRRTSARAKTPVLVNVSAVVQPAKTKGRASNKKKKVDIKDVEFTEEEVIAEGDGEAAEMEETAVVAEAPAIKNVGVSAIDEKGAIGVGLDPSEQGKDPNEMEESVVKEIAKSSECVLPWDEEGSVEFTEEEVIAEGDGEAAEMEETAVVAEAPAIKNVGVSAIDEKGAIGVGLDPSEQGKDPNEMEESVVKEIAKSSECVLPWDEEGSVELEDSVIEGVAKSSESLPPCDEPNPVEKEESIIEEVAKSSESVPPCDEEDHVQKEDSVVEEAARSSENEPLCDKENPVVVEESVIEDVAKTSENEAPCDIKQSVVEEVARNSKNEPPCGEEDPIEIEQSVVEEESRDTDSNEATYSEPGNKVQNDKVQFKIEDTNLANEMYNVDEEMEEYGEKIDFDEHGEEELPGNDAEDHEEETVTLEDERKQLTAIAKERKIKKEREIFLDGLDPDVEEEDVRMAFERIGGIVEVRLQKNPSTNKNKGYAYVEFKDKEDATRALSEMKNPAIRGKQCATAPSEENTTLFIGNICNTWAKEAITQKLKHYDVEGVENINLVPDIQHEGLSRGFAFVEFSCHGDAMLAYKRLQQPDVIFGHPERTAKVGFAEPLCEPDPEVMAQVNSIFVDGLPPHWDERQVREQFKCYGEILRVVLARNMSKAKRKDYGFVDFSSHESAVACVKVINNTPLDDGNAKIKVKARLSNPLPKSQAVKGGIRGGFQIGRAGSSVSRFGRDFGRSGHSFNHADFQRDRHIYYCGRDQTGRIDFDEHDYDNPYAEFRGRGARRGFFRGGQFSSGGGSGVASPSPRPYVDRSLHGAPDRGQGMPIAAPFRRHRNSPQGHFDGPHRRGHFDGPPSRGHFGGPHPRGNFDGPHPRSNFDAPHLRGNFGGQHMRGHFGGQHTRGHFDGPHPRGNFDGQHPRGNFDGPHPRGNFDGPHPRGNFDGPHPRGNFDGQHTRGHFGGPHTRGHFGGPHTRGHFDGPHTRGHYNGPHMGGHFDGPSLYDQCDRTQDLKRPFHMRDYNPDYSEPSRQRLRLNDNDPTASFRGNHYSDAYGAGSSLYPHEHYVPESHYGPRSSYYGPNQSYGRGRYY